MGDCEVCILDSDGKMRGSFRINNSSQVNKMTKKFMETESQLIHSKIQAADAEMKADELRQKIKEMEEKVKLLETSKFDAGNNHCEIIY